MVPLSSCYKGALLMVPLSMGYRRKIRGIQALQAGTGNMSYESLQPSDVTRLFQHKIKFFKVLRRKKAYIFH